MSGVELWSIAANALIIQPDFPFLRLFKKFLTAEIGKKLSISASEVEKELTTKVIEDVTRSDDDDNK